MLKRLGRRIGWGRAAGMLLLGLLLALRIADPGPVADLRNAGFDIYQRIKPRAVEPQPVVIIDIDDPSIEEIGQWPWPRTRFAEMIDKAAAAGAVAIAFDIVFAEPDRLSPGAVAAANAALPDAVRAELQALPDNDVLLGQAFGRARVIAGQTSVRSATGNRDVKAEMRDVPHAFLGPDPTPFLMRFPDILQNLPPIEENAAGRGVFTVRPDPDGIYRRIPLVMMVQDKIRLGLAPELLRVATGGDAFAVRSNAAGIDGIVVARQLIETDANGKVWPYFSPSVPARFVPAADLLNDRVAPGRLAGHLVLVGTSAIGLEDFRPTPLGRPMPGVEIHAQLLENILSGTLLKRPNFMIGAELVAVAVMSLLVIALVPAIGAAWILGLAGLLLAGYAGASWYLFAEQRLLLDPTFPIAAVVLTLMLMSTANYLAEERQRRQIRTAFGQYVSPDLVAQLADEPERLTLGGERREITILFSDVRGFTALAESFRHDPAGLTRTMNELLTELSRAILDTGGTIDKFMGDAVMAFWNAPVDEPDHARRACAAALAMRVNVDALNDRRRTADPDAVAIDVGVGLNTGTAVVGNMGSDMRFDYTAIGDSVNLASRLEGQAKTYGIGVLLGEETARAVSGEFAVLELDLLRVKGKTEPERVFGLIGGAEMRGRAAFGEIDTANTEMRAAYLAQDWAGLRGALARVEAAAGALGVNLSDYAALYRARADAFEADPPGPDWDGVFTATAK
jgi:adenylate cyclase